MTRVTSSSGRTYYDVASAQGAGYVVLPGHCECQAFCFKVLKAEAPLCKHELAAKLAHSMGMCAERSVTDAKLQAVLCHDVLHTVAAV